MTYEARIKQLEEELAVKIEELARISAELGDLRSLACRVRLAGGLAGAQQMSQQPRASAGTERSFRCGHCSRKYLSVHRRLPNLCDTCTVAITRGTERLPSPRVDGLCCDCTRKQAKTVDRRFCKKCLKRRVGRENPEDMTVTTRSRMAKRMLRSLPKRLRNAVGRDDLGTIRSIVSDDLRFVEEHASEVEMRDLVRELEECLLMGGPSCERQLNELRRSCQ